MYATYCTSYVLKAVERVLKNGQILDFPDILTLTTPNLYTVLASKLKLELNKGEFYRGIVSDDTANKLQKLVLKLLKSKYLAQGNN